MAKDKEISNHLDNGSKELVSEFESVLDAELIDRHAPIVSIYESEQHFLVHVELPGIDRSSLNSYFSENSLIIEAESKLHQEMQNKHYIVVLNESFSGKLKRRITFNCPVLQDSVQAEYQLGVLKLQIKKDSPQQKLQSQPINVSFSD